MDIIPIEYKLYPDGYNGNVIDDLSNNYSNCNFDTNAGEGQENAIQFKICVYPGKSKIPKCYHNGICKNQQIRLSSCNESNSMALESSSMKVGLQIRDEIENGTVISVYCLTGTEDYPTGYAMVFNIGICKLINTQSITWSSV